MVRDHDLTLIAERIVTDFSGRVHVATVLSVLRECADKHPDAPSESIEQAARMQLQIRNQGDSR
jgi:hypothetical protein